MKKLIFAFLTSLFLVSLGGCQSFGQSWSNMIDGEVYNQNQRFLSKPKNVQKCWENLSDFDRKVEKHPVLANAYAQNFENKIYASTRDFQSSLKNPCVMLNNYIPAAQRSIARARYIGAQPGRRRN